MVSMDLWLVSDLVVLRPEVEAQGRTDQTGKQLETGPSAGARASGIVVAMNSSKKDDSVIR